MLAGTAWKEHSGDAVSADLLGSAKDIAEHAYAVQSVADVLARATVDLDVPAAPGAAGTGEPDPPVHRHHRSAGRPGADRTGAGGPPASDRRRRRQPDRRCAAGDPGARADAPRPVRRPGRLDGQPR